MTKSCCITTLLLLSASVALSQGLSEKMILKKLERGKWAQVKAQLQKSLRKDSIDAGARYVMARYFFDARNPHFHVDSAYRYTMEALQDLSMMAGRYRDRLRRIPLDSTVLVLLRQQIDSAAFQRARETHTEEGYNRFMQHFRYASQLNQAREFRDQVAFDEAKKKNTYQAFEDFLKKYPDSRQADEAQQHYEKLLYESFTRDRSLTSYESFLHQFPHSPYRLQAERQVFELTTATGDPETFVRFLKKYPSSAYRKQALNVVYYLVEEEEYGTVLSTLLTDSLKEIGKLNDLYLVPILKDDRFGFIDEQGHEVIQPVAIDLNDEYICGNVTEDILVLDNTLVARNGKIIFKGPIDELDDLGYGFLKLTSSGCVQLLHKSGFMIGEGCSNDTKVLAGRFIALETSTGWRLYTLTGRPVQVGFWSEVKAWSDVIALQKDGQWNLITCNNLGSVINGNAKFTGPFSDIRVWSRDLLWVRQHDKEGVFDSGLNIKVPIDAHVLKHEFFGALGSSKQGVKVYDTLFVGSDFFQQVKVNKPWCTVQQSDSWRLFDPFQRKYLSDAFERIDFIGLFATCYRGDSVKVFFDREHASDFVNVDFEFLPAKDSNSFLIVVEGDKKSVYNRSGAKLFTVAAAENIQYAEGNMFIVLRKEKKGLVDSDGKVVIPIEMDAIGNLTGETIPLLKGMRFGLFSIKHKKMIKPAYDKNIITYNDRYLVAFKDGAYGFIGWDNKPHSSFEYQEVIFWSTDTALVKKNFKWMLLDVTSGSVIMDNIQGYSLVADTSSEKIAIVRQNNHYGVISSIRGIIIPVNFSDIINVGSPERPLFFTEKHVEEASLFVVIYYDHNGKLIRRQVFEPDDYDRIYCSKK